MRYDTSMLSTHFITAAEAGLSRDEQIEIALFVMDEQGGQATIDQVVHGVEEHMGDYSLSKQGKNSLTYFLSTLASRYGWVRSSEIEGSEIYTITERGSALVEKKRKELDKVNVHQSASTVYPKIDDSQYGIRYIDDETIVGDGGIMNFYDYQKISVSHSKTTIRDAMHRITTGKIVVDPKLQQGFSLDKKKQSRFIESILLRMPIPVIGVYAQSPNNWVVINGLREIHTLDLFINHNGLSLSYLDFLSEVKDLSFDGLPGNLKRLIEETELQFYIVQPSTPPEIRFSLFDRMNLLGTHLSSQQIRHSVLQGKSTNLLIELSTNETFLKATGQSINPRYMDDCECVLRFLAFYTKGYSQYSDVDFNGFLIECMENLNALSDADIDELRWKFVQAMKKATLVFGENAFRRTERYTYSPVNKSLFEVWSTLLLKYTDEQLSNNQSRIVTGFEILMKSDNFLKSVSVETGTDRMVGTRFEMVANLLARVISDTKD